MARRRPPRVEEPSPRVAPDPGPRPGPTQVYVRVDQTIVCPACGADDPQVRATKPGVVRYYRCRKCTGSDGAPTAFKVAERLLPPPPPGSPGAAPRA